MRAGTTCKNAACKAVSTCHCPIFTQPVPCGQEHPRSRFRAGIRQVEGGSAHLLCILISLWEWPPLSPLNHFPARGSQIGGTFVFHCC